MAGRAKRKALKRKEPAATPAVGEAALARVRTIETLEDAYEAWLELKLEHAAQAQKHASERKQLADQGEFLVGAVRAASATLGQPVSSFGVGLVHRDAGLDGFLKSAEAKLLAAREDLERQSCEAEAAYAAAFASIRSEIRGRVERFLAAVKPRLALMVRHLGPEQRIVHLSRVKGDEAVLLLFLLCGRIPSRYGFLFDDSTDDAQLAPPTLYPEEGVSPAEVRPAPQALLDLVRAEAQALPVKGFLPVLVARPGGGEEFYRLLQRGPVMEVEKAEGGAFRNILTRAEAEAFAGHLLRLKLEGRITLELEP